MNCIKTEHNNEYLPIIEDLDLSRAGRISISDHGFRAYDALTRLNMSNTKLESLKYNWFDHANRIESLDISHNKLSMLNRENLRTLTKLLVANFSYNDIEEVQAYAFDDVSKLQELRLNYNQLARIVSFGQLDALQLLDLSDNSIDIVSN